MPITTQLNQKANVKLPTAADTLIAGRRVISLEELQVSTLNQSTIIIGTFAVDVNNIKNLLVIVNGKILTEGAGNDFTLTSISPNNTSNTISLTQPMIAGLNIKLLYLGVVVTNSVSLDTLSPAISDWVPFSMTIFGDPTAPTRGTIPANGESAYWRRLGDSMEIVWSYRQFAAGVAGSGPYGFGLPPGYSIDYANKAISSGSGSVLFVVGAAFIAGGFGATSASAILPGPTIYPGGNAIQIIDNADSGNAVGSGFHDFSNANISYSFRAIVPIQGWSSNVIAQNSKVFQASAYAANGTNVTSTPDELGEYRTYTKNSAALTGTDNAPTGGYLPTNANGFKIDGSVNFASAGTSGQPNRWEIFIGINKYPKLQLYSSAGRTGPVSELDPSTSTSFYGVSFDYDPTTGVAVVDAIDQLSGTTTRNAGRSIPYNGGAPSDLPSLYFDIIVSDNILPVQFSDPSKVAENEIRVYGGSGQGSTNTAIRVFTNVDKQVGTAITYVPSAVNGDSFVINEAGMYGWSYADDNTGGQTNIGSSRNSTQLTTGIATINISDSFGFVNNPSAGAPANHVVAGTFLKVGDVIRAHGSPSGANDTSNAVMFRIAKLANG